MSFMQSVESQRKGVRSHRTVPRLIGTAEKLNFPAERVEWTTRSCAFLGEKENFPSYDHPLVTQRPAVSCLRAFRHAAWKSASAHNGPRVYVYIYLIYFRFSYRGENRPQGEQGEGIETGVRREARGKARPRAFRFFIPLPSARDRVPLTDFFAY